jgi:chromosome segregation ATPase
LGSPITFSFFCVQNKRKTTIKEIGMADLEFLSDERGNYISFFIAADPKPQTTVASGGGFGSMLMGTEGMSKAATNAESTGFTVNLRGLDVGSNKEKAAQMSHLLAAAEQKVVEWSASGARKDDALAKLTAEKDALLAEKYSLAAEKDGLASTAASSAELESKLAKCDADLAAASEASSKLSQELAEATSALEAANAKVTALEAAAAEAETAGGPNAEAVAAVEADLTALKRKADFKEEFYKKEKDKHKAALGELEEQIAALEASSAESNLALEAARQDLEAQVAKAAQVEELTASLEASQAQSAELESKLTALQSGSEDSAAEVVRLQAALETAQADVKTAQADAAAAKAAAAEAAAAGAQVSESVVDKDALAAAQAMVAELTAAQTQATAAAKASEEKAETAAARVKALEAEVSELSASLATAKATAGAPAAAAGDNSAAAAKAKELQAELDEAQEMMVTLQERTDELEEELEKSKKGDKAESPEADTAAVTKLEAQVSELQASLEQAKKEAVEAKTQHNAELKKMQDSLGAQDSSGDAVGPPGGQNDNNKSTNDADTAALEQKVGELEKQLEAAKVAAAAQAQELLVAREAASNASAPSSAPVAAAAPAAAAPAAPPIKVMIPEREAAGFVCGSGGKVEALTKGSKVAKAEVPVGWRLCKIGKEAVSAKISKKSLETKLMSTRNMGKKYSLTFEDPTPPAAAPAAAAAAVTSNDGRSNSNAALEAQVADLTKALAAAQAQVDELQSSLKAAGDNSAAAAKAVELQTELDEAQEMMVTLQERTDELEEELEKSKKDASAAAPAPEADTAAVTKLEAQVSELQASLEQAKKEAADVKAASASSPPDAAPSNDSGDAAALATDLSTAQAQLQAAQDLATKSAAQVKGLEDELAASQKQVDQHQVALSKERERINEKVAEIEAAMAGQGIKLQSTEVEAAMAEMAKESVAREVEKNKAIEEKLQAVVVKLEKELEAAKAAKEVAPLDNAQSAPGPQAGSSDAAGDSAAAAAATVAALEKKVESLEADLAAARNSAKGASLEAQKGGGNAKLEKELAELKKKEKALEAQIKKLKAEVIDGEKDEHSLEAKVVKLQKALHAEEEKATKLKEAAKASDSEVKTLKQEVKTLRTNLNKMSDSAVKLVKKLEGQVEKLEADVKKEAKEQDLIMAELQKLQHMEKEADKLEDRAEENDKKLDAQAASAKKTRKDLRNARKKIAAIDTDSEEEEEPPPPPVKMNMAFEGMTAEDFTEEKKEQMMKDLAKAYGISDWRLVKIKGLKVGSLVLDIEVEGFEDLDAAKKFSKVSSLEPPPMDEAIYGRVQAKVDKIVNPSKAIKVELEKFKGKVAEDEARIEKLHASLGELGSDLAATKATLQEASATAEKEGARAVALEGAVAEAQKSIEALSGEGGEESLAQRVAELSALVANKETDLANALADKAALESKLQSASSSEGDSDQPPGAQANEEQAAELAEAQEMLLMLQERIDELQPLEAQVGELNRQLAAQAGASSSSGGGGEEGGSDQPPGAQANEEQAAELAEAQEMLLMLQERIDELQPLEAQVGELNRQLAAQAGASSSSGGGGEEGGSDQPPGAQANDEQAAELAEAQEMLLMLQERIDELEPLEAQVAALAGREAELKRQLAALDGVGSSGAGGAGGAGNNTNDDDENAGAVNPMVAGNDVEGRNPDGIVMEDHDVNPLVAGAQEDAEAEEKAAPEPLPPLVVTMDGGKPAGFTFDLGGVVVKATKSGAVAAAGVKAGWRLIKVEKTAVKATEKKMQIDAKLNKARISGKKYTLTFDPPPPISEKDASASAAATTKPAAAAKATKAGASGKKVTAAAAQAMEEELTAARASAAALTAAKEDLEKQVAILQAAAASASAGGGGTAADTEENDEMMMMLQERIDELEPLEAKVAELQAEAEASAERIAALESTKDPDLLEVQKLLASAQAERDVASARLADLEAAAASAGGPGAQAHDGEGVNPLIGEEGGEAGAQGAPIQGEGGPDVPAAELSLRQALATANERAKLAEKKVAELQTTLEEAEAAAVELEESMIAMADEGEAAARVLELQKLLDEATAAKHEALKRAEAADDAEGAAKLLLKRLQKENRKSIASQQKLEEVQSMTNASGGESGDGVSVAESAAAAAAEASATESENALLLVISDLEERVASMNEAKTVADEKIDELTLELEKVRQSSTQPEGESKPSPEEQQQEEEDDDDSVASDEQAKEEPPAPQPQGQPQEETKSPEEQLAASKEALRIALERVDEAEMALAISEGVCDELKVSIEAVSDGNGSEVLFRLQKDLVTSQTHLRTAVAKKQTLEERVQELSAQAVELSSAKAKAESEKTAAETAVNSLKLEASSAKVKQMEAEKVQGEASAQALKLLQALDLAQQELATQATSLETLLTGDDAIIVQRVSKLQKELKECRAQIAVSEQSMDSMTKAAEQMERTAAEREIERDALERKLVNVRAEKTQLVEQAQAAAAIARAQSTSETPKDEDQAGGEAEAVVEAVTPLSPTSTRTSTAVAPAATEGVAGAPTARAAGVSPGAYYSAVAESKVVAAQANLLVAEGRARSVGLELSKCQRKVQELERTLAALQPPQAVGVAQDPQADGQASGGAAAAAAARLVEVQDDLVSSSSEVDAQKQRAEDAEMAASRLQAEASAATSRCEALEAALVKATGSSKAAAAATKAAQAVAKTTALASDAVQKDSSSSQADTSAAAAAALEAAEARAVTAERQAAEAAKTLKEAMADEGNLFARLLNLHNELVEARGAADAAAREAAIALKRCDEAEAAQRAAQESSYKYQSEALAAAASLAMAEQRANDLDQQITHAKQQESGARAALAALTANSSGDAAGSVVQDLVDAKALLEEQVATLTKTANKTARLEKDKHGLETKLQALERQLVRQYSDLAAKQEVLDQEKAANLLLAEAKASRLESSLLAATRAQAVTEASVAALLSSSSSSSSSGSNDKEGASDETTKSTLDSSGSSGGAVKMSASEVAILKEQASAAVSLQASLLVSQAKSERLTKHLDAAMRANKKRESSEGGELPEDDDDNDDESSARVPSGAATITTDSALTPDANSNLEADLVSAKASFLVAEAKCWQLENELAAAQARAEAATRALKAVDEGGNGEASEVAAALAAAQTAFADKLAGMAAALEAEAADRAATERATEVAAATTAAVSDGGVETGSSRLQARLTAKQEGQGAAASGALSPEQESSRLQARLDAKAAAEEAGKGIEPTPEANAAATKLQALRRQKGAQAIVAQKKLSAAGGNNEDLGGGGGVNLEAQVTALTQELEKAKQEAALLKEAAVALNGGDDAMVHMLQSLEDKVVTARDQAQAADARTLAAQASAKEAVNKAAQWQAKVSALEHCLVQAATLTSSSSSTGMGAGAGGASANDDAKVKLAVAEKEVSVLRNALSSAHEAAAASGSDVTSLNARLQQELVASQLQHATRDATLVAADSKTSELQQKVRELEATLVETATEDQSEDVNHAFLLAAAQLEASEAKAELLQESARRAARVSEVKSLQNELVRAQRVAVEAKKSLDLMLDAATKSQGEGEETGAVGEGEGDSGGASAIDARTSKSMARLDELHKELAKAQEAAEAGKEAFKDLAAAEEQRDKLFKDKRKLESKIKKLQGEVKKQTEIAKAVTSAAGSSGGGSSGTAAITATIRVVFKKYDKDHSGSIDASELRAVMDDLGIELDDEQADRVYRAVDKDNSGQIDIDEFAAWWHDRNSVMFTSAESASELLAQVAAAEALAAGHQLDKQTWQAKCADLEEQLEVANQAAMAAPKAPVGAKEMAESAKAQGLTHELQAMYASELAAARATEKLVHDRVAALKVAAGQRAEKNANGDGHLSAIAEGDEDDDEGDGSGAKTTASGATVKKEAFPPATEEQQLAATKIQGKARQKKAKQRLFNKKAAAEVSIEATPETNAAATKLQGRARMKASKKDVATRKAKTQEARATAGPSENAAAAALASEAEAGYEAELLDTERMLRKLRGNIQELEAAQLLAEGAPEQMMEARARQELVQENEDLREIANGMADEREELLEELAGVRSKLARAEVMAGLDPSSGGGDAFGGDLALGVGGDRGARESSSSLAVLNVTPEMMAELPAMEQELERLDAEASVLDDSAQAAEGNLLEAADALAQVIEDLASAEKDVADATALVESLKAEVETAKSADARGAQAEAKAAAMGGSGSLDEWQGALEELKANGEMLVTERKAHEDACQAATVRIETCERETNAATVQQLMLQEALENAPADEVAALEQKTADLEAKLSEIAAEKQSAEQALSEAQAQLADCQERLLDNTAALMAIDRQIKLLEPTAILAEAAGQRLRLQQLHKECERQNASAEELSARAEAALEEKRLEAEVIAQRVEDIR